MMTGDFDDDFDDDVDDGTDDTSTDQPDGLASPTDGTVSSPSPKDGAAAASDSPYAPLPTAPDPKDSSALAQTDPAPASHGPVDSGAPTWLNGFSDGDIRRYGFYGGVLDGVDRHQQTYGRPPNDDELLAIGRSMADFHGIPLHEALSPYTTKPAAGSDTVNAADTTPAAPPPDSDADLSKVNTAAGNDTVTVDGTTPAADTVNVDDTIPAGGEGGEQIAAADSSSPAGANGLPQLSPDDIVRAARRSIGSHDWSYGQVNDDFGKDRYKCNKVIADKLEEAGGKLPAMHHSILGDREYPPTAGDWGDPDVDIPGWKVVDGPPQKGDVLADPHGVQLGSVGGSLGIPTGHVAIATGDGTSVSAASSGDSDKVVENDWGFRPSQHMVIRRYTNLAPAATDSR